MDRVKEPELMDSPEQSEAYAEADFSSSEEALINGLGKYLQTIKKNVDQATLIVDLGCGPGNISEKLAMRWPSAHVLGIDGSLEMLKIARKRSESSASGLNRSSLSYELASLKSIIKKSDKFNVNADIVISNSVLHHVHNPSEFWNGLKVLSCQNVVHYHRDLKRPDCIEDAIYLQEKYLPDAPEILKKDFLASLCASFTIQEVKDQLNKFGLNTLKVSDSEEHYLEIFGIANKDL